MAGFFDPFSQYGGNQAWQDTPLVRDYLEPDIPQGVYTDFLSQQGFGGMDRKNAWARNQYGQTQSGFQAAMTRNPMLSYRGYLDTLPSFQSIWNSLTPGQQGQQQTQFVGPTRMIRWG